MQTGRMNDMEKGNMDKKSPQASYKRDLNHNYLILQGEKEEKAEGYEIRMLTENQIEGFLAFDIRSIDGEIYYYYEISSKQSMERIFESKAIGYEFLKNFFFCFQKIINRAEEYLLDTSHLLIIPEYLYVNLESGEIALVFYPDYTVDIKTGFQSLAEYFLNKIDHQSHQTVLLAYQFYKDVGDDNFTMKEILSLLWEESTETVAKPLPELPIERKETICDIQDVYQDVYKVERKENVRSILPIAEAVCMLALFSLTAAKFLGIIELTYHTFVPAASLLALAAALIGVKMYQDKKRGELQKEERHYEEVEKEIQMQEFKENEEEKKIKLVDFLSAAEIQEEIYGNTVFLGNTDVVEQRRLCGKIQGKEITCKLDRFPFLVGKLDAHVDLELRDKSVSRIHARFTQKEDSIYLEDLNSTNGSYKNGMPLEANESVRVEMGDEIRFGQICFVYD